MTLRHPAPAGAKPRRSPGQLVELLLGALERDPAAVSLVDAREFVSETARPNGKHPASLTVLTTDDVVKSLRGAEADARHLVLLVSLRMDVVQRLESPIVLPGEVRRG